MTDETPTLSSLPSNHLHAVVDHDAPREDDEPPPPAYPAVSASMSNAQNATPASATQSLPFQVTPVAQRAPPPIPVPQSQNPFTEDVRQALPAELAARVSNGPVHVIEQRPKPFWDSSFDDWHRSQSQEYNGETGEAQGTETAYQETEYYEYETIPKKKGFFKKLLRSVQRMSSIGSNNRAPVAGAQNGHAPNSPPRELTADELALNGRYSNPLHSRFISLEATDHTHPSDVCVHNAMNRIYLADTGRSIIEIFDMNGQVLHAISDPAILKFQPNRFVVTADGTLIISSAVLHCLYMYSPASPFSENFQFQQFKLGAEGNLVHQFCSPSDMVTDTSTGYVYVCDVGNYRIKVLTPQGMCERIIQLAYLVNGVKQYLYPTAITYQPARGQLVCVVNNEDAICFVSKHANGRTYIEPLWIVDENGVGLQGASSLAVDSQDRIFISDTLNHRIVICTAEGAFITSFGTQGAGLGQLDTPRGIDVMQDGSLIVTEVGNRRMQIFGSVRGQTSNHANASGLLVQPVDDLAAII